MNSPRRWNSFAVGGRNGMCRAALAAKAGLHLRGADRRAICVLAPKPSGKSWLRVFGPVPAGMRTRDAIRRINDFYQLRDCPQKQELIFADQWGLQGSLAPPAACGRTKSLHLGLRQQQAGGAIYAQRAAKRFLAGLDDTPAASRRRTDVGRGRETRQFRARRV
ncbi:MAG: hypothetical protein U0744_14655 [Gemmataceae bacterium]